MNLKKIIRFSVPFFAIAIVSRAVEEISFLYYTVPIMCVFFVVLLLTSSELKAQYEIKKSLPSSVIRHPFIIFLLPGIWFLLTALWSSYPNISAERALYFILISSGSIAAGILWVRYSDLAILDFLLPVNVIVILICLFSIVTNIPSNSWTAGNEKGFLGYFGHQNLLASVIMFTLPAIIVKLISIWNKNSTNTHLLPTSYYLQITSYYLLLAFNILILILTYSRASITSFIFGIVVFLLLTKKWKLITYSFSMVVVFAITIYLIPSLNNFSEKIINKDFPEFYSSRIWMWEPSYEGALEGGLVGLGYGISDPEIRGGEYIYRYEDGRLIREKGNSTLALIEETGVIGFLLFLLPIICLFLILQSILAAVNKFEVQSLNINNAEHRTLSMEKINIIYTKEYLYVLIASILAFVTHAQFEAWWVGVGSVQLPLFFLYFGLLVHSSAVQRSYVET